MELAERIYELVRPTAESLGYSLVRVQVSGRQRLRLQIMAERADDQPMMIDDCANSEPGDVSRTGCRGPDRFGLHA